MQYQLSSLHMQRPLSN